MRTYVALLRGVNVGKAKRVPMADFRRILTKLGFTDVVTLLNSGNAVFRAGAGTAQQHATGIAAAIVRRLGVDVPVIVKSAAQLASIVEGNPFPVADDAHSRFLVAFTQSRAELASLASPASRAAFEPLLRPGEQFAIGREAVYLHCAGGILESKAGEALLGRLGRNATTRNLATTLKLHALARERA